MSAIRTGIRWLLVPVAAAAVLSFCTVAARLAVTLADRYCPMPSMVGGSCVEPWHTTIVEVVIYTACALAASGVVLLPALVAPRFARAVAAVTLTGVLIIAGSGYLLLGWAELLMPVFVVAVFGAAALAWVWFRRSTDAA